MNILTRIHHLLRLANDKGATAAEAATAAAIAQELMLRHKLSEAALKGPQTGIVWERDQPVDEGDSLVVWKVRLAGAIARLNQCRILIGQDVGRVRITLAGRPADIAVVRHLYEYLRRQIERLSSEYETRAIDTNAPNHPVLVHNFRLGAVDEVTERLRDRRFKTQQEFTRKPTGRAAIVRLEQEDRAVEVFCAEYADGTYTPEPVRYSHLARQAGRMAGREIALREAIAS